jgi:Na+/H+ antiporter NhaD/arsenite permease-like protein
MRLFFYLLSLTSALISGVMEDVSVALIVNPIIFRATKILKLDPKPFLYGVTASIILGNLLTPIASPVNIIFATAFEGIDFLDFQWFITYLSGLFVISMVIVLLFIDVKYLRKIGKPDPQNLRILLEIMDPNLLIRNKGRFYRYILYLLIILIGISMNFYPYIFIAVSVTLITLFEEHGFTKSLKKVNWGLPFLYIGLFLLIGSFQINGSADAVGDGLKTIIKDYLLVAILIVFFISGLISSFVSKSLSLLMFAAILDSLFFEVFIETNQQMILVLTLFVTLHLIGNFVPQSSSFILKTIEQAESRKIDKFNYTSMARSLRYFTLIEAVIGLLYIFALALFLKVF